MSELIDYSKEFSGLRVLVTGGSRGIGGSIAQRLIDGGATVAVTARAKHEQTPAKATFIEGDLRSKDGVEAIAEKALKTLGGLDILVNNAGAARVHLPGSSAISDEEWLDSLNINLLAVVRMTNATVRPQELEDGSHRQHIGGAAQCCSSTTRPLRCCEGSDERLHPLGRGGACPGKDPRQCRDSGRSDYSRWRRCAQDDHGRDGHSARSTPLENPARSLRPPGRPL